MTDELTTCNCDDAAWQHCGHCLCCPDLTLDTYRRAAAVGLNATDLTHIVYHAQNAGADPNRAVESAITAAKPA